MSAPAAPAPRLLIVEADGAICDILSIALEEEGYLVSCAASLEKALPLLEGHVYHLILVDLFTRTTRSCLAATERLRRHAQPTPIALMTTQPLKSEDLQGHGFAFLLMMPFDLEEMLALVAIAVHPPLTLQQQRQADVVARYFAAANARDWDTMVSLCTEDVCFYPPAHSQVATTRRIEGKVAFYAYIESVMRCNTYHIEEEIIYPRRKGLAAAYTLLQDGTNADERHAGVALFHFAGERICQIGIRGRQNISPASNPRRGPDARAS